MRLAVNALGGRRIGCLNQAEIGAAIAIEPVSHVFDAVLVLDVEVLVVRRCNVLGGHAAHVVAIHKDWHEGLLLPFARATKDIWSDVLVRGSHPDHWRAQAAVADANGEAAACFAAASLLEAVDHSTTRVGLRATGRDTL